MHGQVLIEDLFDHHVTNDDNRIQMVEIVSKLKVEFNYHYQSNLWMMVSFTLTIKLNMYI